MDLRNVRTQFLDRKMKYACSYDPKLAFSEAEALRVPGGVRVVPRRRFEGGSGLSLGNFFHVLDAISIVGVDDRKHNCPVGAIESIEETVLFRENGVVASIKGRMSINTEDRASIDVTYQGVLRFRGDATTYFGTGRPLEGGAWIVPLFETTDTRYRWLSEQTCIAFGTWNASRVPGAQTRNVTGRLDVYSTG